MTNVISVRFRSGSKTYFFDPQGTLVRTGDNVIVETLDGYMSVLIDQRRYHVTENIYRISHCSAVMS